MIYSLTEFADVAALIRRTDPERTIVFANGCFLNLHEGHLWLLSHARFYPNHALFLGVNGDVYQSKKYPTTQVQSAAMRALIVGRVAEARAVCIFDEETPTKLLEAIMPHVYLVGEEYCSREFPYTSKVHLVSRLDKFSSRHSVLTNS